MKLLTVAKQKDMANSIHSVLTSTRPDADVKNCTNLDALRSRLLKNNDGQSYDAILVDIDSDPEAVFNELAKIIQANPQSQFIVVSDEFTEDLILRAMHTGARHFIRKKQLAAELAGIIEKLLINKMDQGRIISILSCSGGCGATTTANNLASEFSLCSGSQSLIVDLDLSYGAASRHMGLEGSYGIDHVLAREGLIDRDVIESVAVKGNDNVSVLLSPASVPTANNVHFTFDRLGDTLNACKELYGNVVIDASRACDTVLMDLAAASDAIVVVLQMTVGDLRYARSMINRLTECGLPSERIIPVANRVRKQRSLLDIKDARQVLQPAILHCIRNDWSRAMKSVNKEKALSSIAKRSGIRRDFHKLANRMKDLVEKPHAA
jgi:pilus assembly protein CpaE